MLPDSAPMPRWGARGRDLADDFSDNFGDDPNDERGAGADGGYADEPDTDAGDEGFGAGRRGAGAPLRSVDPWLPLDPWWKRFAHAVSVPGLAGIVVFLAAIVIALGWVWRQPHEPGAGAAEQAAHTEGAVVGADAGDTVSSADAAELPGVGTSGESVPAVAPVFAHVVGAVQRPGVVELPTGSRVRDAVEAAGGATAEAVLSGVNLARVVVDGEQIVVPDAAQVTAGLAPHAGGGSGNAASGGADGSPAGVIDLNAADATQLESLPRVGPALAQRILDWRAANGNFASVDQLLDVPGIGAKTLDGFRDRVRVS